MYNQDAFINILKRCQEQLSLNEFARKVDVNSGYLSKIINYERNNPPRPTIQDAKVLKIVVFNTFYFEN